MKERTLLILLVCGLFLTTINAQMDEEELINEEILAEEGSGGRGFPIVGDGTIDDEDGGENYSGDDSGDWKDDPIDTENNPPKDSGNDGEETNPDPTVDLGLEEDEPEPDHPRADDSFNNSRFFTAVIIGGSVGLLFAICVILLLLYRMRKKDEGSYAIDDEKKKSNNYPYTQGQEYYA